MSGKCPFCQSDLLENLSHENLVREFTKKEAGGLLRKGPGSVNYSVHRHLCLECGMVFEQMAKEDLKKYRADRSYFTENRWYYAK